jgi:hypothetical protein
MRNNGEDMKFSKRKIKIFFVGFVDFIGTAILAVLAWFVTVLMFAM